MNNFNIKKFENKNFPNKAVRNHNFTGEKTHFGENLLLLSC